jgi:glycosyltransferase involved in cell wall biosynthesis
MRITAVIGALGDGGAQRVCVNLANAWVARGRDVTILTTAQQSSASVYALDSRVAQTSIADLAQLRDALLATEPDVVVSHIDYTNLRVLAAMKDTGVPVVACEHTDTKEVSIGKWQSAREILYRDAAAVVAPHASTAEWLARRGARAVAIANALVPPVAQPASPPMTAPRERACRVVSLTRLSAEKRVDVTIRAFAMIAADHPRWQLALYGDGPQRWSLERLAEALVPSGQIRFHGFVADSYRALAGADLFVSSSWVEGFGNAIWEAMACGVPVVATECGAAVQTIVRHGIDGIIVPRYDTHALAVALSSLMSDGAARAALASRAADVRERFSFDAALRAWDALLEDVAAVHA